MRCAGPAGVYINVQGLICHMHSGTPRTILYTVPNNIVATTGASTVNDVV